jgi:hypothetical protein
MKIPNIQPIINSNFLILKPIQPFTFPSQFYRQIQLTQTVHINKNYYYSHNLYDLKS